MEPPALNHTPDRLSESWQHGLPAAAKAGVLTDGIELVMGADAGPAKQHTPQQSQKMESPFSGEAAQERAPSSDGDSSPRQALGSQRDTGG